jgi:hypothetical protein
MLKVEDSKMESKGEVRVETGIIFPYKDVHLLRFRAPNAETDAVSSRETCQNPSALLACL